jgi:hypothetical protein
MRLQGLDRDHHASADRVCTVSAASTGAERVCDLRPKGRVVERVTHWENGRAVGLEVAETDWPIRFMHWVTRIEPTAGGALITQKLEYAMTLGPLGWLLDRLSDEAEAVRYARRRIRPAGEALVRRGMSVATKAVPRSTQASTIRCVRQPSAPT